jgi:hypothetical protein
MQAQVRNQPRTGREPIWYYEVYRGNQIGPAESGQLFDFEDVKKKITSNMTGSEKFVRIIGPREATREQLDELRQMGAYPTFP